MNTLSESRRPLVPLSRFIPVAVLGAMLAFAMWGPLSNQFWSAWQYPSVATSAGPTQH